MGINLLYPFRRPSPLPLTKRLSAYFPTNPIIVRRKQSSSGHEMYNKAPSTADEFERIAEEKKQRGIASQTSEKAADAAQEAAMEESGVEGTVKEKYKEPVGKGNFHKTGDNQE